MRDRSVRVVALALAAIFVTFALPGLLAERDRVTSAPGPPAAATPAYIQLAPGAEACTPAFHVAENAGRVVIAPSYSGPVPKMRATLDVAGRRSVAESSGFYVSNVPLTLELKPAPPSGTGRLCVTHGGKLPVALQAGIGWGEARVAPAVALLGPDPETTASMLGTAAARAASSSPWRLPGALGTPLLLLALAVIVAIVVATLRMAPADGPGTVASPRASAVVTWGRAHRRVVVVLAAVVATGLLAWLVSYAIRTHVFNLDEELYSLIARYVVEEFPGSLFTMDAYARGTQRLEIWIFALATGLFRGPEAFVVGHTLTALAYASAAVPVYLICRTLGLARWPASFATLMGVATPWAVSAVTFLPESPAYAAFCWLTWACLRAIAQPGVWRDLLAVAALGVGALGRTNFLVLPVGYAFAALVASGTLGRSVRAFPRRHPVTTVAALLAIAVVSARGVTAFLGSYEDVTWIDLTWGHALTVLDKSWAFLSRLAGGLVVLPAMLAVPWLARHVLRPRDPAAHAFALLALLLGLLVVVSAYPGGPDERYVMFIAPLVWVAAVAAVVRDRPSWPATAAGAVFVIVLLLTNPWASGGPSQYYVFPGEATYAQLGLLWVDRRVPSSVPLDLVEAVVLAGIALLLVRATRREAPKAMLAMLLIAAAAAQLYAMRTSLHSYVDVAGAGAPPDLPGRSWIDAQGADRAGAWLAGAGAGRALRELEWREAMFFNRTLDHTVIADPLERDVPPYPLYEPPADVVIDDRTGRISGDVPPRLVLPTVGVRARPRGTTLAQAGYIGLELIRPDRPARLAWQLLDAAQYATLAPGVPRTLRFYAPFDGPCAVVTIGHSGDEEPVELRVGGRRLELPFGTGTAEAVVRLRRAPGRAHADVRILARNSQAMLTTTRSAACPAG